MAQQVTLALQVFKVILDLQVQRVLQAQCLVQQDRKAQPELLVNKVRLVLLALPDQQDQLALPVQRVRRDLLVR